ncbi:MAG: hypothetical protein LBO81_03845, partial [Clostridiales Family XIII bacterium]|nr:hypothetical protein [Clostridiales Family XIII bacterium]
TNTQYPKYFEKTENFLDKARKRDENCSMTGLPQVFKADASAGSGRSIGVSRSHSGETEVL